MEELIYSISRLRVKNQAAHKHEVIEGLVFLDRVNKNINLRDCQDGQLDGVEDSSTLHEEFDGLVLLFTVDGPQK